MASNARTAGDGMESTTNPIEQQPLPPNQTGRLPRLVQVFPKNIEKHQKKDTLGAPKPQKFVPYEPYPAAVKPMVPHIGKGVKRSSKNNMDINTLINQMSQMNTNLSEFKPRTKSTSSEKAAITTAQNDEMQKKIAELVKENDSLKEQLNQQAQVNKELKTMLVASMGEDLETQVQSLADDKKHLADALLNSAQHLSTHQEQTEWLAGQCEVWRSKFLASSLMIEELAHWKRTMTERTNELQQAIGQLLDERVRVRDMMLCTYRNLYSLHENWLKTVLISEDRKLYNQPIGRIHLNTSMPHSSNVLDLASVNMKIAENVGSDLPKHDVSECELLPASTDAEQYAEQILSKPVELKKLNETPVAALVQRAYSSTAQSAPPVAACQHCHSKVQLL